MIEANKILINKKMNLLFTPGNVYATPAAIETAQENNINLVELLTRHLTGDFGKYGMFEDISLTKEEIKRGAFETSDDGKLNKIAILNKAGRIISSYQVGGDRIWVITEHDRSYTTLILPSEY
jgi:hypothetical protein